jgi:hypothetical protein
LGETVFFGSSFAGRGSVALPGDSNETWVRIKDEVDISLELNILSADSGVEAEIDNVLEDEICTIGALSCGIVELVVPGR